MRVDQAPEPATLARRGEGPAEDKGSCQAKAGESSATAKDPLPWMTGDVGPAPAEDDVPNCPS